MEENESRRSFFGKAAVVTGAVAAGVEATGAMAAQKTAPKPVIPTTNLLRIGVIALGDNSHMNYEIWAPMINPIKTKRWPYGRTTRMVITHCWDPKPELAANFAKKYNCEAVKNYYDMVGKVDGMIFAGFNECKWWPQLTKPYLEAGIPCYINRPFAYSMKSAKEMVERSKKFNAPILCTDERESIQQAVIAKYKVDQFIKEGKRILGGHSTNASGEWSQHGVHGLYFLLRVFGIDVDQAAYQADGWWHTVTPTATKQNFAQLCLLYKGLKSEDGSKEQKEPFMVSQYQNWPKADITLRVYNNDGWWDVAHEWTPGPNEDPRLFYLFYPTILQMQIMFETKQMPWTHEYILKKTQIFLTAFKSHLEHNGALIKVDDLPDDWEAPSPYDDWIDEAIFK